MTPGGNPASRSVDDGSSVLPWAFAAFFVMPVLAASAQQTPLPPVGPPPAPPAQFQTLPDEPPPLAPPASDAAPQADTAPQSQAAPRKDGFFDALGRWLDKSSADFKASVDKSNENWRKLHELNEKAAKDAADAFSKLSGARIVDGRELCEVAPNGSPDCQAAAEKICKTKGFALGKSADIQTSRKCSARAWLSGNPSDSACTMETVVTKAACQ